MGSRLPVIELIDAAVSSWIRARDFDEVYRRFQEAGAALAPIYDVEQLMDDPQVAALDAITTIDDEDLRRTFVRRGSARAAPR